MAALARSFEMRPNVGPVIDEVPVPWFVAHEDDALPMVQPLNEVSHILWLPVLMAGAVPSYGSPKDSGAVEVEAPAGPKPGDLCRFLPDYKVEHFHCDEHADHVVTDVRTGKVVPR